MNNVVARKVELSSVYSAPAVKRFVATVTISVPPTNVNPVYMLGDGGKDILLLPGEWHTFKQIDLSKIFFKGTPGEIITVIGGTW